MRTLAVGRTLVLFVGCALGAQVMAGVGGESAGVTPTIGNGTDATPNVQQQSAGFVQQNQQLQAANGIALPASASAGARPGQAAPGSAANAGANAEHSAAAQAEQRPTAPPPPPPTYVSVIKPVVHAKEKPAADPPQPTAPAPAKSIAAAKPVVAPKHVATFKPTPPVHRVTPPTEPAAKIATSPPPPGGGRGSAPDGMTFYAGLAIAAILLALAFGVYLRTGKIESGDRD